MNVFAYLSAALTVIGAIVAAQAQYASGQTVTLPEVRTYIGGHHVALDITVKPL